MTADPFAPAAIADETERFNRELRATLAAAPSPLDVPLDDIRRARAEGKGIFRMGGPLAGSDWVEIEGAGNRTARLRRSLPDGVPCGVYLHIHGGGWSLGNPDQYDLYNQRIARETGFEVLAVEYRLAPEHPWPAAPDDCLAAARWVLENRDGPVVIGGESAGAHLSAVTALALRDLGLADRLAAMVLLYGMYDLRMTAAVRQWGDEYLVLSTPVIAFFCDNLLGNAARADDPAVSPLLADLSGLPPALFQCGTMDPLIEDTLFMEARWRSAGHRTELHLWPGGVHAYDQFELGIAERSHAVQDDFVKRFGT